jgi:hypothetical protein
MTEEKKEKCLCCEREVADGINIRVSDDDGFMSSCRSDFVCDDCLPKHLFFVLSTRAAFIRDKEGNLYCRYDHPYGNFHRIRSDAAIDKAFNPERHAFQDWLNK